MRKEKPLVIVATPNICWLHPEVAYPGNAVEIGEEAALCPEPLYCIPMPRGSGRKFMTR